MCYIYIASVSHSRSQFYEVKKKHCKCVWLAPQYNSPLRHGKRCLNLLPPQHTSKAQAGDGPAHLFPAVSPSMRPSDGLQAQVDLLCHGMPLLAVAQRPLIPCQGGRILLLPQVFVTAGGSGEPSAAGMLLNCEQFHRFVRYKLAVLGSGSSFLVNVKTP